MLFTLRTVGSISFNNAACLAAPIVFGIGGSELNLPSFLTKPISLKYSSRSILSV